MDLRLALMCGVDIPIPECQLTMHQPTIKEIALLGESTFFQAVQCLTISKNMINVEDESLLTDINNFQIFMMVMTEKTTQSRKQDVLGLLQLLFPKYKVSILPRSLLFSFEGNSITVDDSNFDILQDRVKDICCFTNGPMDQSSFNPKDRKAKEIAQKLMRGRSRVAAQNGQAQSSIFSQYLSVLTVGIGSMSLEDCTNLTMYQLFDLIERYGLYTNWDIDIRSRLAGAKVESKPDNWMKNIH